MAVLPLQKRHPHIHSEETVLLSEVFLQTLTSGHLLQICESQWVELLQLSMSLSPSPLRVHLMYSLNNVMYMHHRQIQGGTQGAHIPSIFLGGVSPIIV